MGGLVGASRVCGSYFYEYLVVSILDLNSKSIRCCRNFTEACTGWSQPMGTAWMLLRGQGPAQGQALWSEAEALNAV